MITCIVRYRLDRLKLAQFEIYAKKWIKLVQKFGGHHHGYFMPAEGKSDEALCLFSFESLAAYEIYRQKAAQDPDVKATVKFGDEEAGMMSWDRSFYRPVFGDDN